ncbi:MAG: acyl-CoA dehydrogenase family protein [Gemmatimonadales bacterium]
MRRRLFEPEHQDFRNTVRGFVEQSLTPRHPEWEQARMVSRDAWTEAGALGLLSMDVPEEYGGSGVTDFRYNAIVTEELAEAGLSGVGFPLHTDIVVPYLIKHGGDELKRRWLPKAVTGEGITAIAMSEPAAGSDLQGIEASAVWSGDHYLLNGQKTFISNGLQADLVVVVARTNPAAGHKGISLLAVERGMPGFERGRNLEKIGQHAQDTAELFFRDVRVPRSHLLGEEGSGFRYLMEALPVERLTIAVGAVAQADAALRATVAYCRERRAFGRALAEFQHVRFELAEMRTEIDIGRAFVDRAIEELNQGGLDTKTASEAKWWTTDMCSRVTDRCLQLFGGYGYMVEYPIARHFVDSRVARIYGGSNEIMKEIIGRAVVAGD